MIPNKSEKEILEFVNYLNLREGYTIKFIYVPYHMGRLACTVFYTMDSLPLQESIDRQANCIFSILNEQFFTDKWNLINGLIIWNKKK